MVKVICSYIGVDKLFVRENADYLRTAMLPMLEPYIDSGVVEFGLFTGTKRDAQGNWFNECSRHAKVAHDWVALIDSDEFIIPVEQCAFGSLLLGPMLLLVLLCAVRGVIWLHVRPGLMLCNACAECIDCATVNKASLEATSSHSTAHLERNDLKPPAKGEVQDDGIVVGRIIEVYPRSALCQRFCRWAAMA